MRLLTLFLVLLLIVVIGAGVVAWFDLAPVPVLTEWAYSMKGYGKASTPDEALDRFNKALQARDYEMAARFLDGDFAVELRKQAKVATRLARAIDNLRHACKDRALNADEVERILATLEPFPQRISKEQVQEVKKLTGFVLTDKSFSALKDAGMPDAVADKLKPLKGERFYAREAYEEAVGKHLEKEERARWKEPLVKHADKFEDSDVATAVIAAESSSRLVSKTQHIVTLRKVDGSWRIHLPLTPGARALFDDLDRYGQDFVNALDTVKNDVKREATTKSDVAKTLENEIRKVRKPI